MCYSFYHTKKDLKKCVVVHKNVYTYIKQKCTRMEPAIDYLMHYVISH